MIAIIVDADCADVAEFMEDETGKRLLFKNYQEADAWLEENNDAGVAYRFFDDEA